MTVTMIIAGSLFGVGALLAAVRLVRGPTPIDRAVALDVLVAVVVGIIVLLAAVYQSTTTLVIAVVVALLGFVGSAALAQLLHREHR